LGAYEGTTMSLPAGEYSPASITYIDKSAEKSTMQIYGETLTEATFDDQAALWLTLANAVDAITLGNMVSKRYAIEETFPESIPASNSAQRENKLLVLFKDATNGQKFTATIPTIDLSKLTFLVGAGDAVSMTVGTEVLALVAAWNAFAVNPVTQNATLIYGLKFVGRNS